MDSWRVSLARLRGLFQKEEQDRELEDELASHLELQIEDHLRAGMSPAEARRQAAVRLGGFEAVKESYRDQARFPLLDNLAQDVRIGWRGLMRNPVFTATSVLLLALGIGINASIFSIFDAVVIRDLPIPRPGEIVTVTEVEDASGEDEGLSYPDYVDLRRDVGGAVGLIARGGARFNLAEGHSSEHVRGELVSGNYYDVLGVRPHLGRLLEARDEDRGASPVAVVSYAFWARHFGSRPEVVGEAVVLNDHPVTIVGVSPPGFYGLDLSFNADVRIPLGPASSFATRDLEDRSHRFLTLVGRLAPGGTPQGVEAALEAANRRLPGPRTPDRIVVGRGSHGIAWAREQLASPLALLQAIAIAVLVIVSGNLGTLWLARGIEREREIALRAALGASQKRLLSFWLTESLLAASLGGGLGAAVGVFLQRFLVAFVPVELGSNLPEPLSLSVLAFIVIGALLTGVWLGFLQAVREKRGAVLIAPARRLPGRESASLRRALLGVQIALSIPLLVGSGLLVRSLQNLEGTDLGFSRNNILVARLDPGLSGFSKVRVDALYRELPGAIEQLPGVRVASLASTSPVSGGWDTLKVSVEGHPLGAPFPAHVALVSPRYFDSLGIGLVRGRDFVPGDAPGSPKVAIVNETLARECFQGTEPLGKRLGFDVEKGSPPDVEIVGVVKDAKYVSLREGPTRHLYVPLAQATGVWETSLLVSTREDPTLAIGAVRAKLALLEPRVPLFDVRSLASQVDASLLRERLISCLSTAFGILATGIGALALYGVITFSLSRRAREIGIRKALGARGADIVGLTWGEVARPLGWGTAFGLLGALAVGRLVRGLLFAVGPLDPWAFGSAALVFAIAAGLAWSVPTLRVLQIRPGIAIREE